MFAHPRLQFLLSLALSTAAACPPAVAKAAESADLVATVTADDLDLAVPAGVAALRHRVAVAAHNVCASAGFPRRMESDAFADCVRGAMRKAEPQTQALLAQAGKPAILAGTASAP